MPNLPPLRAWSTPLTIAAFFLMATTGVLMFFEFSGGLVVQVHQWFSWIFLAGAAGHIWANVRPLKSHLRSVWGRTSLAAAALIFAASFASWGIVTGSQLIGPVETALVNAPLSTLAELTHAKESALMTRLAARGITATGDQSVHDLSRLSSVGETRILAEVFPQR